MRRVWILAVLWLVGSPQAFAAPRINEFAPVQGVSVWMHSYRAAPDPAAVPAAIKALSRAGTFKEPETAGVYVGFFAGVLGTHPKQAEALVGKMLAIAAEDQWVVVRAVAYSGLRDWKGLLARVTARMPHRQVMIEEYTTGKLPVLNELVIEDDPGFRDKLKTLFNKNKEARPKLEPSPEVLDTLWGYYLASGAYLPIGRMIAVLPWSTHEDNVEKLTIGSMSKYALASNAVRDMRLLAMLKSAQKNQPEKTAKVLKEVIHAAETAQITGIRKQAMAAIEDLKRKGPGSRRKLSTWGTVGQGAIALGCIAAAATGQAYLGLPCVVGGAASSAAINYWSTQ